MHDGQSATVITDVESERVEIWRGTKEGDPLISWLFYSALQYAIKDDNETWIQKGFGVQLWDELYLKLEVR